ncbi:hypothetical protein RIF29_19178 [Crotalaria pallida]|uniref:Uncharacterized protein n=1 Tax=Crotalaria pallida TaxID=3830 RepID=A0AAN9EZI7_CROPI
MSIPTVLVLPCPGQGHVIPMMTFSQKLAEQGCTIIFVNTEFNHKKVVSSMAKQESIINGASSSIKLVSIPDGLEADNDRRDIGELFESITNYMPAMFEKLIEEIHLNGDHRIICIVADVIMGWAMEVAQKRGIRGALFWTASATTFALVCSIPMLIQNGIIDSEGMADTKKTFQLSPSMPIMGGDSIWWSSMNDSLTEKIVFNHMLRCMQHANLTDWWLCNTAYELEPASLSFVPKLLPIGPLLRSYDNTCANATSLGQFWEEDQSCMSWLDQQPHRSVLYVAFGSFTLFDQNQFTEIALGLKLTNRPFLWVVRQDYNSKNKMTYPNEFTGHQGKIVGWAPQQKVLNHPAIACFVSHCGWNSTLEGLSNGVPFLCWPYFADQIYDKIYICDELKVGLGFSTNENGLVPCGEIKAKVDKLLNDENIRSRSLVIKEKVFGNLMEDGCSSKNLSRFIKWLKA